jgi:phage anti-repressor protein
MYVWFKDKVSWIILNMKETPTLDIVKLIEQNPITKLTKTYQSKLVNKIKAKFDTPDQQLFVTSFYCYLNYSKDDYVIDLDNIWKWMGFSQKVRAKELLVKHFCVDVDYKFALSEQRKRKNEGGFNKETIILKIETFKTLCLLAQTEKGKQIRSYFLKLEETLLELLNEESRELRLQLEEKDGLLKQNEKELNKERALRNKMLNRRCFNTKDGEYVYVFQDNLSNENSLLKVGKSTNLKKREEFYSNNNNTGGIIYYQQCQDCDLIERVCHHLLNEYRINKMQEFFECSKDLVIKTIKDTICFVDSNIQGTHKEPNDEVNEEVNKQVIKSNTIDFDKFIKECCELSDELINPKSELKQAYRVWSKCSSKEVASEIDKYLQDKFKSGVVIENDIKRNIYKGIKLKPFVFKLKGEEALDYEQFIIEECKTDYQYRISYVDFFNKFIEWKKKALPKFKLTGKYKKEIQEHLETVFAGGRVHLSSSTNTSHLYGLWGCGMEFNNYGLKIPERTCKKVAQYNADGTLIQEWESLSVASRELNIAISSLSNYCRFNNVINNCVYRYI